MTTATCRPLRWPTACRRAWMSKRSPRSFTRRFSSEHQEFLDYMQGIDNEGDRRWYTSVILNRLMFVYFSAEEALHQPGGCEVSARRS
jgi:hypothetical protein